MDRRHVQLAADEVAVGLQWWRHEVSIIRRRGWTVSSVTNRDMSSSVINNLGARFQIRFAVSLHHHGPENWLHVSFGRDESLSFDLIFHPLRWSSKQCTERHYFICQHRMSYVNEKNRKRVYNKWNETYPNQLANEVEVYVANNGNSNSNRRWASHLCSYHRNWPNSISWLCLRKVLVYRTDVKRS